MNVLTNDELKETLRMMKEGDMTYYEVHKESILTSMVDQIGSTDGELRDRLIYTMFFRLIVEQKDIEVDRMSELLETSLHTLLFHKIEETQSDAIFTRAFTTLLMALILHRDVEENFLTEEQFQQAAEGLIRYLQLERDTRGYVNGRGWAHSIAHAADAVDELIANPKLGPESFPQLFHVIINQIMRSDVLAHDEDERLIHPLLRLLERGMDSEIILRHVERLPDLVEERKQQLDEETYWYVVHNVKIFLKSLYIRLSEEDIHEPLRQSILITLKKL
ncbi:MULTISPECIES: DUF2785 domain-containing protein [unclassified Exiguobacterium]|uniref:DUF2785 domain-containing protein n=1 Tax=unclassified Exiguobacterium TaxID=2644629 RepID=UPI001BEA7D56|nr:MULTISPECIES: DUF2785 domain-containing protein [unclassified Exiguobacterium]